MATDFLARCDAIEECYEFTLAYAGQGLLSEEGGQVRRFLERFAEAVTGIAESCNAAAEADGSFRTFSVVLERDAQASLAAIRLVLAQPVISSQLVDNLNASTHVRALLTDLFLLGEIVRSRNTASQLR